MDTDRDELAPLPSDPRAPVPRPRRARGTPRRSFWRTPTGILTAVGLGLGALVFAGLIGIGYGIEAGYLPDTEAIPGERLQPRVVRILREADILEPDERVLFYYSAGMFRFLEDGNLFTDRRVISYWEEEGELQVATAPYAEIDDISAEWTDDWLEDTQLTVHLESGDEIYLFVSNEAGGDRRFHEALRRTWEESR